MEHLKCLLKLVLLKEAERPALDRANVHVAATRLARREDIVKQRLRVVQLVLRDERAYLYAAANEISAVAAVPSRTQALESKPWAVMIHCSYPEVVVGGAGAGPGRTSFSVCSMVFSCSGPCTSTDRWSLLRICSLALTQQGYAHTREASEYLLGFGGGIGARAFSSLISSSSASESPLSSSLGSGELASSPLSPSSAAAATSELPFEGPSLVPHAALAEPAAPVGSLPLPVPVTTLSRLAGSPSMRLGSAVGRERCCSAEAMASTMGGFDKLTTGSSLPPRPAATRSQIRV